MLEAIYDKWKSKVVTGEEPVQKPKMLNFINTVPALEMLHKYISTPSNIAIHCDVDMDGIGSGYIMKRFISSLTYGQQIMVINKEKQHGIAQKHADYFRENPIDFIVILDSSSNDIEIIKQFTCDVLVVDHHEISHGELSGMCNDGTHRFVIVNNMVSNPSVESGMWLKRNNFETLETMEPYQADSRMSCGLVIYELLRVYQEAYKTGPILENMMLYQWVGVTLLTDAIQLLNDRNQWYMEQTVHSMNTEPTLFTLINTLNKFEYSLSKSVISYTLAPTFNRAIRAGAGGEALSIVMEYPNKVEYLQRYRELQDWCIAEGTKDANVKNSFVLKDITGTQIGRNYCGVIASTLCDSHNKNVIVYKVENGIADGSFRGRLRDTDYRAQFERYKPGVFAQGHGTAFGFKAKVEDLENIMASLEQVERSVDTGFYLTAGDVPEQFKGKYHINDIDAFKKLGGLMMLGIGNSKVSSDEQIVITVPSSCASIQEIKGKLFIYNTLGLPCKAFKEIVPGFINIYIECTKSIEFYLK